jgi:Fe-S-cluster-containing dehydrogenase component/anaerobic selenocysteine-containing dehydrogenase
MHAPHRAATPADERMGGEDDSELELGRRDLFKLAGASMALAGLGGCMESPGDRILPYVVQPPEVTPGIPLHYATSLVLDGFATGVLAETREGRPVKIEGNPEHPASLGATSVFEQASVLQLYDPDRARGARKNGAPASWRAFFEEFASGERKGLWFLLHPQSSPLIAHLMKQVEERRPGVRFAFHSPLHRRQVYRGASQVFGRALETQYDFSRAEVILSLDADFLASMPMSLRWARQFAQGRRLSSPRDQMNRLYAIESMPSPTGSLADHRLRARSSEVAWLAGRVLAALMAAGARPPSMPNDIAALLRGAGGATTEPESWAPWIAAVARDLRRAAGASIVIAGDGQPAEVHALAHWINAALNNIGTTITFTEPALLETEADSLADLVQAIEAGEVDRLVIIEANPVYTAPADLEFLGRLERLPRTAHVSLHANETSRACQWFLPAAHILESWGDARAYDGTISFIQPLIQPLHQGRSTAEILAAFAGQAEVRGYDLVRALWRERLPSAPSFEHHWERHVQRGFIPDSGAPAVDARLQWPARDAAAALGRLRARPDSRGLEIAFVQSPKVYDGRFANNGWLQELPHPMTKLTWDNAAILSPRTARELAVSNQDVIEIRAPAGAVRAPVLVLPGHVDGALTLALGYGRQGTESLARGVGVNAYALRTSAAPWFVTGVEAARTGATHPLALTQEHWKLDGRELALHNTVAGYRASPDFTYEHKKPLPTLLPRYIYTGDQWAMTIDTGVCTGCSACVIACQAENNIPLVGKRGVRKSREMHWLRIDRYFIDGDGDGEVEPRVIHQPMLCQHCEMAPCEYVCPVNATVHSPDGLNEMVYNRCIGTRFCSNNCPYKVRRFNWFKYTDDRSTALQRNPDVTVRERGVMEKCTYCVQRIRRAEIQARLERRELAAGDVVTACQQACPTEAITFGSLAHEDSEMVRRRRQPRVYSVLHDQGTRPRTQYLAKIHNPNPEIE